MTALFIMTASFLITLAVIKFLLPQAARLNLLDVPDARKTHIGQIPIIGGTAMFIAFMSSVFFLNLPKQAYFSLVLPLIVLFLIGVLDDMHRLSPIPRLFAQILAAGLMAVWGQDYIHGFHHLFTFQEFSLGLFAIPFTMIAVIAMINAVNMLDGIDGLAGSLCLVQFAFLGYFAYQAGNTTNTIIAMISCSILVAYLFYNLQYLHHKQARIFMGDAGSMLLGFLTAWCLINFSQPPNPAGNLLDLIWFTALPLFDLMALVIYRLSQKRSPLQADREHLHHLLKALGLSDNAVVGIIVTLALCFCSIGITFLKLQIDNDVLVISFILTFAVYFAGLMRLRKYLRVTLDSTG